MDESCFHISFHHNGLDYDGRVSPDKKDSRGQTSSWHVVLNEIFFGYLSRNAGRWVCSEWRPEALVNKVGGYISEKENGFT